MTYTQHVGCFAARIHSERMSESGLARPAFLLRKNGACASLHTVRLEGKPGEAKSIIIIVVVVKRHPLLSWISIPLFDGQLRVVSSND